MSNAFAHENTPFGTFGEFEGYDQTADWTDEDWQQYDAEVAQDIADFEAQTWHDFDEFYADDSIEPPF